MKGTCEQIPFYFFLKFMMLRSDHGLVFIYKTIKETAISRLLSLFRIIFSAYHIYLTLKIQFREYFSKSSSYFSHADMPR